MSFYNFHSPLLCAKEYRMVYLWVNLYIRYILLIICLYLINYTFGYMSPIYGLNWLLSTTSLVQFSSMKSILRHKRMNFFIKFGGYDWSLYIMSRSFLQYFNKKFKPEVSIIKIQYVCSFSSIEILDNYYISFNLNWIFWWNHVLHYCLDQNIIIIAFEEK